MNTQHIEEQNLSPVKGYDSSRPFLGLLEIIRTDKYGYICKDANHVKHEVWFCDMRVLQ